MFRCTLALMFLLGCTGIASAKNPFKNTPFDPGTWPIPKPVPAQESKFDDPEDPRRGGVRPADAVRRAAELAKNSSIPQQISYYIDPNNGLVRQRITRSGQVVKDVPIANAVLSYQPGTGRPLYTYGTFVVAANNQPWQPQGGYPQNNNYPVNQQQQPNNLGAAIGGLIDAAIREGNR
jgi:hypothetical protein